MVYIMLFLEALIFFRKTHNLSTVVGKGRLTVSRWRQFNIMYKGDSETGMASQKEAKVFISNYDNAHLSAVGNPPQLYFVHGTDKKHIEGETFLMYTDMSLNSETTQMTVTMSHSTDGQLYDVTARGDHTVILKPRGHSTNSNRERQFLISQAHKTYILMESLAYEGQYLCSSDNTLHLRSLPESTDKRNPFYFSVMPMM